MESELLKEPWAFSRTKASTAKEEDPAEFSAWEEDFQDLSSWCMDTFQGQCDFHIGESNTFKLSGTKYEGNGVSVEKVGILKDLRSTTDDEKWDLRMNTVKTTEKPSGNDHLLLSPSTLAHKYEKGYGNEENYLSSSWLMSPESTASTSTSSSKQRNADAHGGATLQNAARNDLDYVRPTSFDSTAIQRETWDELHTIGSDTFDLLSYLCDDELRSPEGSVSADSSALLKLRPHATSSSSSSSAAAPLSATPAKVKIEKTSEEPATRRRIETRATSTVTSSSAQDATAAPPRRSERTRAAAAAAVVSKERERISVQPKKESKAGRKRYYESDSEDDVAFLQYRECREKNNEASRKSRMNKKAKESEMSVRALELERDNRILKMKVEELEKLVTSMRSALLRSALKKEF